MNWKLIASVASVVCAVFSTNPGLAQADAEAGRAAMLMAPAGQENKLEVHAGTVVWSTAPADPNHSEASGVRADIEIPDLKLHAIVLIRKNIDPQLPASHTIDLHISFGAGAALSGVNDFGMLQMRRQDAPGGARLLGTGVKINDGYYLIGLSPLGADVGRNAVLLDDNDWFDFSIHLSDNRDAKLTFEKGAAGKRAITRWMADSGMAASMPAAKPSLTNVFSEESRINETDEEKIKQAKSHGDVFTVTGATVFAEQILKARVIRFQPGAKLVLNNYSWPWVAIVADRIELVDPSVGAQIRFDNGWRPRAYPAPAEPTKQDKGKNGAVGENGAPGARGTNGLAGHRGEDAPRPPQLLYLIFGSVEDQQGRSIHSASTLSVVGAGYAGGNGGNGGPGGPGGDGGNGGDGEMGWFSQGCLHNAGAGGNGGIGGKGGPGGVGGYGSAGSNVSLVGPSPVLSALSDAAFELGGGQIGPGGMSGPGGSSGKGGAPGAHPGTCGAGRTGATPVTPRTPVIRTLHFSGSFDGGINRIADDNVARFLQESKDP